MRLKNLLRHKDGHRLESIDTAGEKGLTDLLALTTVATYVVIILGATLAITDIASVCQTWPTCNGRLVVFPWEGSLFVVWGYRLTVLVTGILVGATAVTSWLVDARPRVRVALLFALVAYPVQSSIGGVLATSDIPRLPAIHLGIAMSIFTALLLSLTWRLDSNVDPDEIDSDTEDLSEETAEEGWGHPSSLTERITMTLRAYYKLTKPRLMWLLCLVALAGIGLAVGGSGESVSTVTVAATLVGGVLSIGSSGTFNQVLEREVDQKMDRTSGRPLVDGVVPVRNAVAFGLVLGVASLGVFVVYVNVLAAVLDFIAILFYTFVYTVVLKPNTTQNIVIGGAVGALPALIGWSAVTNTIGVPAVVLGAVIFLWTPAHFYNLALAYKKDYERGDFPMLPVVRGERVTLRHILLYLGATLLSAGVLGAVAPVGWLYGATTVVLGSVFIWTVLRLYREQTKKAAFRSFHASNIYLGTLLISIVVETLVI
ncbi:MAG: heme o synthase [Halobacteria archaeon]|nr:heme o synthase [Halobacteria archaeon]